MQSSPQPSRTDVNGDPQAFERALTIEVRPGAFKWVLCLLAWKSVEGRVAIANQEIATISGLNIKTVNEAIQHLVGMQHLEETGRRVGQTRQIVEYRLL